MSGADDRSASPLSGPAAPLEKVLKSVGSLARSGAASLYRLGAWVDRAAHNRNAAARGRPACAIVSVGGITVGGAGKTPVAAGLARDLAARGWRVTLASRGYRGSNRERVKLVSDGQRVHASVSEVGDEALLLAAHAPGVSVLVGRDRHWVGHHAVAVLGAEILVLDDGFQHHRLLRDIDCVCLDGASGAGNGKFLPAGPLREPVSSLARADWIVIVDGVPGDAAHALAEPFVSRVLRDEARVGGTAPAGKASASGERTKSAAAVRTPQLAQAKRVPTRLVSLDLRAAEPLSWLSGRQVGLLAGIAQPGTLRRTLESLGAEIVSERCFPDHHAYEEEDLEGLDPAVSTWITTEKDALKILPKWVAAGSVWVLHIDAEFPQEGLFVAGIEAQLQECGRLPEH